MPKEQDTEAKSIGATRCRPFGIKTDVTRPETNATTAYSDGMPGPRSAAHVSHRQDPAAGGPPRKRNAKTAITAGFRTRVTQNAMASNREGRVVKSAQYMQGPRSIPQQNQGVLRKAPKKPQAEYCTVDSYTEHYQELPSNCSQQPREFLAAETSIGYEKQQSRSRASVGS